MRPLHRLRSVIKVHCNSLGKFGDWVFYCKPLKWDVFSGKGIRFCRAKPRFGSDFAAFVPFRSSARPAFAFSPHLLAFVLHPSRFRLPPVRLSPSAPVRPAFVLHSSALALALARPASACRERPDQPAARPMLPGYATDRLCAEPVLKCSVVSETVRRRRAEVPPRRRFRQGFHSPAVGEEFYAPCPKEPIRSPRPSTM